MIKKLNLKDSDTVKSVLTVQMASYKVEADIIGFYEIPPLNDTINSLKECDEIFYGYYIKDILAGIISYKVIGNILDIHRVAVHPDFFRLGIAGNLINFIERLEPNINKIVVCTGKKNQPAIKLYFKNGYEVIGDMEINPGIYLTEFEKRL
ncbi:GNAT family N-acetyltransferase [Clostridium sp.]|uniref:GNAT family N-acetyltransferase n=1 Tax=Clostridium sp. TaxID=1506 RepID=UPI002FC60005